MSEPVPEDFEIVQQDTSVTDQQIDGVRVRFRRIGASNDRVEVRQLQDERRRVSIDTVTRNLPFLRSASGTENMRAAKSQYPHRLVANPGIDAGYERGLAR